MSVVKIKKGWYRSAGTPAKYGWMNSGYEPEGVGINKVALTSNEKLTVIVHDVEYELDTKEAIEFIRRFKSFYDMPGGTRIGVISRSLLTKKNG